MKRRQGNGNVNECQGTGKRSTIAYRQLIVLSLKLKGLLVASSSRTTIVRDGEENEFSPQPTLRCKSGVQRRHSK